MPIVRADTAPTFTLPGLAVTGLASPSRGSTETSAWRLRIAAGTPGVEHSLDREEIFIAISGQAVATLNKRAVYLNPGDALIVPAGEPFALANQGAEPFEAVALAPNGTRAIIGDGESFQPPWTE